MKSLKMKALAVALGLSAISLNASATDYAANADYTFSQSPLAASFNDWVSFTVGGPSALTASVTGTGYPSISFQTFDLYADRSAAALYTGVTADVPGAPSVSFAFVLGDVGTSATTYWLHVVGTTTSTAGKYAGTISLAPVPEPESYAMMLAGLGLMGFVARRRRNSI